MTPTATDSAPDTLDSPVPGVKRMTGPWWVAGFAVLIIVVVVVGAAIGGVGPFTRTSTSWSAVFLVDNEVYFGHVKSITNDDIDLVNVAYLQKSSSTAATSTTSAQAPSQLSILGLVGNQIQCPKDEVVVNRHNVINVQELQSSSFVVSRLETLSKTTQKCFQPSTASPSPAPAASAAPSAAPSPSTSARATP